MHRKPNRMNKSSSKTHRDNEDGFTLIEIIVALVILATGFLTVVYLFQGGVRMATYSDRYIRGVNLANNKFSELELANFQTEDFAGEFEQAPDYRWEYEVEPFASPLNDPGMGVQLNRVTLNVIWTEGSAEKNVQLTSLWAEGNTTRLAPDTVLLGNVAALGAGGGGSSDPTSTSENSSGAPAPTTTGKAGKSVSAGIGTTQMPVGTSSPTQDPNFQFDISGMPVGKPPPAGGALIGVGK